MSCTPTTCSPRRQPEHFVEGFETLIKDGGIVVVEKNSALT